MARGEGFITVTTVGSLLPRDFLARLQVEQKGIEGISTQSYGLYRGEAFTEAVSRSWSRLRVAWDRFTKQVAENPGEPATRVTRERWLQPLFQELGYHDMEVARGVTIGDKHFPISHIHGHTPIHLLGYDIDLGIRTKGRTGAATQSPHSLVQEFLNRSDKHLWGLLSNGYCLRLLRDNISLTRQAYVEFDLKSMMEGEIYHDFFLLWLLCHASRTEGERPEQCWLEKWTRAVEKDGTRALEHLRIGVENAIRHLGQGFLRANNPELISKLRDDMRPDHLTTMDFYRQLLRTVYRLIFLFAAEDRNLLHAPGALEESRKTYRDYYSTGRIRELARMKRGSPHPDIWRQLNIVFQALGQPSGCDELGLPALGGFLWSSGSIPDLENSDIQNIDLLEAVRDLSQTRHDGILRKIDYLNMDSEELGSIYESLLELQPTINTHTAHFDLTVVPGHERKKTGSYYTPTCLITQLLDTALEPVISRTIKEAKNRSTYQEDGEPPEAKALLKLKICDPASGSGHFLVAAARRVAKHLAAQRTGEEEPAPEQQRTALRDVIAKCIYGVDINPMAVELCKISLWMEALEPGKPLSFLDHHIKQGNSLIGATPKLIEDGIPDEAFNPITGDDSKTASSLKKQNKSEKQGQLSLDFGTPRRLQEDYTTLTRAIAEVEAATSDSIQQVTEQARKYETVTGSDQYKHAKLTADAWCAAFASRKNRTTETPITQATLEKIMQGQEISRDTRREIQELSSHYCFFHWHVEFPEVFLNTKDPGFDVVLGNPPWERVKLQEKEFFAAKNREIAEASNKAQRQKLIDKLMETPEGRSLQSLFDKEKRRSEAQSAFLRASGRFPLCGRGDINTYTVFAELKRSLINGKGRVGCIVPSGIATDDTTKFFFQDIVEKKALVSLYDFENREPIFEGVHRSYKFCLLTLTGQKAPREQAEFVFFALGMEDLEVEDKRFTLSKEDIELLNPNTKTCPIFRTKRDAEITKGIYRRVPVLINENDPENGNPWGIKFMAMFHMANDSHQFRTKKTLESDGGTLEGNVFIKGNDTFLPLYEAKMIHHYNHRFGDYADQPEDSSSTQLPDVPIERLMDSSYEPLPRYWVPEEEVEDRLRKAGWKHKWILGWRDITNVTNERTAIASICPRCGAGDTFLQMFPDVTGKQSLCLLANVCSFAYDYCVRQKMGGTHLKYHYFKQMPVITPTILEQSLPWEKRLSAVDWIAERALELVYTTSYLAPLAIECGHSGLPFKWDKKRRFQLRCELDAAFFYLYGIDREDIPHILESFPIVKQKDEKRWGKYTTLNSMLQAMDTFLSRGGNSTDKVSEEL